VSKYCANELHLMVAEEWGREAGNDGWHRRWEAALCRSYERADDVFKDNSLAPYSVGTTALVAILSPCQIIASNCGDSRVVLSRGKQAIPLTVDHKLDREDEVARITNGGGQIINWGGLRVGGILNMTRAIGDHNLKPWVIAEPEVTFMTRSEDDEFLILASDGLWDVMSSDDAVKLARYELRRRRRLPEKGDTPSSPACGAAEELVKIAYDAFSTDNISVVIVDLKAPRIRSLQNTEKRSSLPSSLAQYKRTNMIVLKITN
ncbi:hypothetical protein CICLE_v10027412mg, partial [Citrus x clementina]